MLSMIPSDQMLPYEYLVPAQAFTALGQAGTQTLVLDTASDFLFYGYLASTLQDAGSSVPNTFTVYIKNNTTGIDLTGGYVPQAVIAPPASYFLEEKVPIRFPRQTQLIFNFLNTFNGSNTINFILKGYKIYKNPVPSGSSSA